ncbi:MAG TPA: polysaccharide deacetylase family protein [Blastocatellia bacterium]|nr:polysaccharide deacetylase family protein [Blastocatellia bacterium]
MKKRVFVLLHTTGITRLAAWWNRKRVAILCYHGVTGRAKRSPRDPFGLHIRRERFAAQLDYLMRHHRVISLGQYLQARRERKPLPDYSVVLTFDDGYRNLLTAALPCLIERGLPVSVFLITGRIRQENHNDLDRNWTPEDDETYLSWDEARALEREGLVTIGSHTCTHPKLSLLSSEEVERELKESREAIAMQLGDRNMPFAYPYGDYSDCVVEQARSAGYVCALTTDEGLNDLEADVFTLRRTLIGDDDDVPAFAARVSGVTAWIGKAAALLKRSAPQRTQREQGHSVLGERVKYY